MRKIIYTCDICGKEKSEKEMLNFGNNDNYVRIILGKKDISSHRNDFCLSCVEKIIKYIKSIKGGVE